MKLTVFPSDKGDCLLLRSGGETMLIDGGLAGSFRESVLPKLAELEKLDCVYLSHIDDDHIGGLIELVNATFDWRVFAYQKKKNSKAKEPKSPKPPEIGKVWHNSFSDLLKENASAVTAAIQQTSSILAAANSTDPHVQEMKLYHANLAESIGQSLDLRFRLSPDQLDIAVNPEYEGDLMYIRKDPNPPALTLGNAQLTLIGPFAEDLDAQRAEWNDWLRDNKADVAKIRKEAKEDAGAFTTAAELLTPFSIAGNALAQSMALASKKPTVLGKRSAVTTPNLASLMFFVQENGKRVLLTGDGHADDVLNGLKHAGALDDGGDLHVDVLKVQHHGSENNMTKDFARRITADHYVFCGNGFSTNPDPAVLRALVDARLADGSNAKFKFWFNSTKDSAKYSDNMAEVETLVKTTLAAKAGGRLEFSFNAEQFDVPL